MIRQRLDGAPGGAQAARQWRGQPPLAAAPRPRGTAASGGAPWRPRALLPSPPWPPPTAPHGRPLARGDTLDPRGDPLPPPQPRSSPFPTAWMPAGGCAGALVPGPSSACPSSACPRFRSHRRLTAQLTLPGAVHPRTASRGGDGAEGILLGATHSGEAISDRPGRGGVCPARERPGSSAGRGRPGSAAGGGGGAGGLAGGVPGLALT